MAVIHNDVFGWLDTETGTNVAPPSAAPQQNFAVDAPQAAPPSLTVDAPPATWSDYGAMNADVAQAGAGEVASGNFGNLDDYYRFHAGEFGQREGRAGIPLNLAVQPPTVKNGMVVDRMQPDGQFAVQAPAANPPTITAPTFNIQDMASLPQASNLMAANGRYETPYYAAYTDKNDFAGAVMAEPGQKIRMVDGKTGEVVYEGTGPEAAQKATEIANAVSQEKGRKAAWEIQIDDGRTGWTTQAMERYDPKKPGIFGTLLDIAAPILLNALLPGVGTALGGALGTFGGRAAFHGLANLGSGLIQGESLGDAAKGALIGGGAAGVTGAVLDKLPGVQSAVSRVTGPVNNFVSGALSPVAGVLDPLNDALVGGIDYLGNIVDGAGNIIQGVGNIASDARGAVQGAFGVANNPSVNLNSPPINVTAPDFGNAVSELVVTGNLPTPPVNFAVPTPSLGGGGNTVSELVVEGNRPPRPVDLGIPPATLLPDGSAQVSELVVQARPPVPPGLPTPLLPVSTPDLGSVVNTGNPVLPPTTQPTPTQTPVGPGLPTPPSLLGGGGGGKFSIPGLMGGAGTRGSLSPIFTANLPAPTFGARTPLPVDVNQRYAIERPEGRFFSNVGQGAPSNFSVPSPQQIKTQGIGDWNGDGVSDELDLAIFRQRFGAQPFAKGGRTIKGAGDGRSDSIPAVLSDGEYVIDAETVALLGNGSSKAGAKRLDDFRVNVRKHKGKSLAKGRFSVNAKDPHKYLTGGRV